MIVAGPLDRRITLERPTVTKGSSGGPITNWGVAAEVWAFVRPASAREFIAGAAEVSEQRTVFRIRWRDDVVTTWRVGFSGQKYRIVGVAEIGRAEGLELQTTAILAPT